MILVRHAERAAEPDDDPGLTALGVARVCRRIGTVRQIERVRAWAYRITTREPVRAERHCRHNLPPHETERGTSQ